MDLFFTSVSKKWARHVGARAYSTGPNTIMENMQKKNAAAIGQRPQVVAGIYNLKHMAQRYQIH